MALLPLTHVSGSHSSHLPAQLITTYHSVLNLDPTHPALTLKRIETYFIYVMLKTHRYYVS